MNRDDLPPDRAELTDRPVAELLDLGRALFEELASAGDSTGERHAARARRLRLVTAELNERAARLGPPAACTCACGQTFATPEDLDDHFLEVFTPDDDIAPDGILHAEV